MSMRNRVGVVGLTGVGFFGTLLGLASLPGRGWAQSPPPPPSALSADTASATPLPDGPVPSNVVYYGAGAQIRWVSVPAWFLGLFTKAQQPLSSFGVGAEFFRRKGDMDVVLGLGYQNMSPEDGNWLGKGKQASVDTDLVQFRNFAFLTGDISFVWHQRLSSTFDLRYGAGLGVAVVTGQILRTSSAGCTEGNASDATRCKPIVCHGTVCTEEELKKSQGGKDLGPGDPHRFADPSVPGAIPVLNLLIGINVHPAEFKGFELRLETGFHDAFFFGGTGAYRF